MSLKKILIIDFGSQFTQLIARRVRELGVYSEIISHKKKINFSNKDIIGIILSGGPLNVYQTKKVSFDKKILNQDIPVLGICFGHQIISKELGGKVKQSKSREFGLAKVKKVKESILTKDFFTKKTNIGIHNDDYIFEMDKKLIKRVGSQGQQKTFIIALRIAEFKILNERLQTVPIMLLDDVFHKLDDKKIDLLLDYLKENDFNQIIISDSIKNRLKKIEKKIKEIKIFKIVSGNVYER